MKGLGPAISMSGMVACGMLFCLASGDFDLSVASVIACAGVTTAVVINLTESLWIGVAAGLLLGILCGLVNGFVIAKLKINAPDHDTGNDADCSRSGVHHFRR